VSPIVITVGTSGWGPFGLGLVGYLLVAMLLGVGAVWATVFLWRRRARRIRREEREEESTEDRPAKAPAEEPAEPPRARRPPRRARGSRYVEPDKV